MILNWIPVRKTWRVHRYPTHGLWLKWKGIGNGTLPCSKCGLITGNVVQYAFVVRQPVSQSNWTRNSITFLRGAPNNYSKVLEIKMGLLRFCLPLCRYGPLFTDFGRQWTSRATIEWMQDCLGVPLNPLVFIKGFDMDMLHLRCHLATFFGINLWCGISHTDIGYTELCVAIPSTNKRKFCVMHSNNLGLYAVINAEGLIMLAEFRVAQWTCTLEEAMGHLYNDFRSWTQANKVSCSHRRWKWAHLHTENSDGVKTYPSLTAKAYNARVILAWLAVAWPWCWVPNLMSNP